MENENKFDTKSEYEEFLYKQKITHVEPKKSLLNEKNCENMCKFFGCKYIDKYPKYYAIDMDLKKLFTIPTNYNHYLYVEDKNGKEIPDNSKVRMIVGYSVDCLGDVARLFYSDVKSNNKTNGFHFHNNIKRFLYNHFIIELVEPKVEIDVKNIKFNFVIDVWDSYYHRES